MADRQDAMQVCLNGHQITIFYHEYPDSQQAFCDECGEPTIYQCPNCKEEIKGWKSVDGVVMIPDMPVPKYCEKCGESFPWTKQAQEAAIELLLEETGFGREEVERDVRDLVKNSPKAPIAARRLAPAFKTTWEIGKGVFTNVISQPVIDMISKAWS
jgi:hypothetical protein